MVMERIDEGSTPKYQHTKMRSERVNVREYGIAVGVTRRMIEDSRFNEVELALNEARKAVDRHITDHFIKVVFGEASDLYGIPTELVAASTEADITTFATNPSGGWLGASITDVQLETGNERVYPYANASTTNLKRPHYMNSTTSDSGASNLVLADVLTAIDLIGQHGYNANTLLISPSHFKSLLSLADFTAAFTVGAGAVIAETAGTRGGMERLRGTFVEEGHKTRAVGNLYGLNIISNPWVPQNKYCVMDSSVKPVAYVERRGLTVEEANPGFGIVGSYLSMRYGLKIVNALSAVVVKNT
jgi:hypothetical protein